MRGQSVLWLLQAGKSCGGRQGRGVLEGPCLRNKGGGRGALLLPGPSDKGSRGETKDNARENSELRKVLESVPFLTEVAFLVLLFPSSGCLVHICESAPRHKTGTRQGEAKPQGQGLPWCRAHVRCDFHFFSNPVCS